MNWEWFTVTLRVTVWTVWMEGGWEEGVPRHIYVLDNYLILTIYPSCRWGQGSSVAERVAAGGRRGLLFCFGWMME